MEEELPALVAHGVWRVAVLVEDCLWDQEPRLTAVQWAHDSGRERAAGGRRLAGGERADRRGHRIGGCACSRDTSYLRRRRPEPGATREPNLRNQSPPPAVHSGALA